MKKTIASGQAFPTSGQRSRFALSSRFALAFNFPPLSTLYAGHAGYYIGEDFTLGPLNPHRYIGNFVISKIVISGFCPIYFTVTFAGT